MEDNIRYIHIFTTANDSENVETFMVGTKNKIDYSFKEDDYKQTETITHFIDDYSECGTSIKYVIEDFRDKQIVLNRFYKINLFKSYIMLSDTKDTKDFIRNCIDSICSDINDNLLEIQEIMAENKRLSDIIDKIGEVKIV